MPDKAEKPRATLAADPEIAALSKFARLMDSLDPAAQLRCLDWLVSRYQEDRQGTTPTANGQTA